MKAAEILDLPQNQLAATLGVSAATVSRMKSGAYLLDPARKEWELAVLWVRAFRSLDAITGGRDEASRAWLHSANRDLRARPVDLLSSLTGVVHLVEYLDEARARI
jgi:uncharacterized protein (DUF2384 family)